MNILRKLLVVIVANGSVSALVLSPSLAVAKSKLSDLECGPNEIPKSDGTDWFCADDLNELSQAIEEIGEFGCSATQQDNSVLISCGDGTGGVIAGAGTVVLYPEGQIGEVPPINYNTGPIVVSDASGVVLGEVGGIQHPEEIIWIYLSKNPQISGFITNIDWLQEVKFLTYQERLSFLSEDCTGPFFGSVSRLAEMSGKYYLRDGSTSETLLFKSWRETGYWDFQPAISKLEYFPPTDCVTEDFVNHASLMVEYELAPEIANAAYPIKVEQLP